MSNVIPIGLRTPEQAKQWLADNGISIARFARDHGLSYFSVSDVLRGSTKGSLGEAHRAAVALGIKPPPSQPVVLPDSTGRASA